MEKTRRWVPVTEALPEPFMSVLGYIPDDAPLPSVHECYVDHGGMWHGLAFYGNPKITHWMEMPEFTEAVPTVDAVEVVRCRDCQKSRELDQRSGYERMFNEKDCVWCRNFAAARWRHDYCSDGERRSETQGEKDTER